MGKAQQSNPMGIDGFDSCRPSHPRPVLKPCRFWQLTGVCPLVSALLSRIFAVALGFLFPLSSLNAQVIISEILASNQSLERDNYGEHSDWLELYNPTRAPVSLWDWALSDDEKNIKQWWVPNLVIHPGQSIRIWCSGRNDRNPKGPLHTNFKLSASGEKILLSRPEENAPSFIFNYEKIPQSPDITFGCAAHSYPSDLLPEALPASYFLPKENALPSEDWFLPQFDDRNWKQGLAPFGMDRQETPTNASEIRTDLSLLVEPNTSKAFFRIPFHLTENQIQARPELTIRFKDGITCYLNGERIARQGIMKGNEWDPRAERFVASDEKGKIQRITPRDAHPLLNPGENLLAVELSFGEGKSVDFHLAPSLRIPSRVLDKTTNVFLTKATPGERNSNGFTSIAPKPTYSSRGGLFHDPVRLALTLPSATEGSIFYTLNGSLPTQESFHYEQPILLTSSAIVTARTFSANSLPSPVTTESFTFLSRDTQGFSSKLPLLVIDTHGQSIGPSEYSTAALQIFKPGRNQRTRLTTQPDYSGSCAVKLRGSSTLNRPKKSYRIELRTGSGEEISKSLLGMPSDGDWMLYGPYNHNKTLINNVLVYELSRRMGHYAPRTRFVEAFIKEHRGSLSLTSYAGLYVLMERIERSKNRIAIDNPGKGGAALSGGYVFKIDRRGPGERGFRAGMQDLVHVDPNEHEITSLQSYWLTQYIDRFFDALAGPNFQDPQFGYSAFIDVQSFMDHRIIQELTRNPDAYSLSTYFTKPRGGKLRAGPVWDFDRAFYFGSDLMERGYYERWMNWTEEQGYNWGKLLMDDPNYRARLRERGLEVINSIWSVDNVHTLIDELAAEIEEAQARNYQRWGHLSPKEWKEWIGYQKRYIARRLFWIRNQFLPPPTISEKKPLSQKGCTIEIQTIYPGASIYYTRHQDGPVTEEGVLDRRATRYEHPIQIAADEVIAAAIRVGENWSQPTRYYYKPPIPTIAVTEIMYHPKDQSNLEFIEIQNTGSAPASLEGLELTDTVDFDFAESDIKQLAPKQVALIVRDIAAFRQAYDTSKLTIIGQYEDTLSDTSGRLRILGSNGATVVDVFYTDKWYPETDLHGHSLNLMQPDRIHQHRWRDPRLWHPSPAPGGTPGYLPSNSSYWR